MDIDVIMSNENNIVKYYFFFPDMLLTALFGSLIKDVKEIKVLFAFRGCLNFKYE